MGLKKVNLRLTVTKSSIKTMQNRGIQFFKIINQRNVWVKRERNGNIKKGENLLNIDENKRQWVILVQIVCIIVYKFAGSYPRFTNFSDGQERVSLIAKSFS